MTKKVKNILIIIIAALVLIIPFYHPEADSGFDGSYSGGSSSGGFSSGSSWGGYSGSYYGGYHSGSGSSDPVVVFITLGFTLVIVAVAILGARKRTTLMPTTTLKNIPPYNPEKLKEYLPDFDPFEFKNRTYEIYKKIQVAWMNFDYDSMRQCVTDEMFNMYKSQLTTLKVKKQTNIMKDFNLLTFNIVGMEVKDNIVSLTVTMGIECYDYITDKNNKVVRGTDKRKVIYNYAMTFNKGISDKPNKCPNCGAPLENVNSSICPYCDSTIIGENYDWILAKKQVLSQRYK